MSVKVTAVKLSEHGVLDGIGNLVRDLVEESVGGHGEESSLEFLLNFTAHIVLPECEAGLHERFAVVVEGFKSSGLLLVLGLVDF